MSPSKSDQHIIDILTMTKQTLDIAQGALTLAPVPGLSNAASALSNLIDIILVAKGNEGTRQDLAKHIQALASIIEETARKAESVLGTDDETLIRTHLVNSPELKERVLTLQNDLKNLINETKNLETGLFGVLLSKKNADTLLRIKTDIDNATRKFLIQGGITVEMLINGVANDIEQIKRVQQQEVDKRALQNLPHVNAGYSSSSNPTKSGTLQGTRTALLEEITEWSLRSHTDDHGPFIYVLSGGAGTGKSTIAFEIAHRLEEAGALGASFFFVHDAGDFNTTTHVLTTIAYQLAHNQTSLYSHIAKAAREYSRKGKQGEQLQMDLNNLIIKPLKNVEASHRPVILVLDALDECTKPAQEEVTRLLFLLMERLPEIPFPVRVFVTTRPEMKIEAALNTETLRQVSKPYSLHEILRGIVDGDIKLFLHAKLKVLNCWEIISSIIPSVVEDLTSVAAGLFIYAYTVFKFLDDYPNHAVDVLKAILSGNPSDVAYSLENLDQLYVAVLRNALDHCFKIPGMQEYSRVILGSLALLQDQVSTSGLSDLIGVEMRFIRDIVERLGSVILKPKNDDVEIRMLHASFPQFLVDDKRCTDTKFYINPSEHHQRLGLTCLEMMTRKYGLKRNICDLDMMKSNIPGLYDTVMKCIQPSLRYSCIHWATHVSRCDNPGQDLLDAVMQFVRTKLLVWVEVLSYMNQLEIAVPALLVALSWCEVHIQEDRNGILQLIDDTHRLVLRCYTPIKECPEHLYISAFTLAPSCVLTSHYNSSDNTPTRNHTVESMMPRDSAWGDCLHTILIDARGCQAMFSPDGRLIASGSSNGEVCIWNASIGTSKRTLKGHTEDVRCVAWAPDGESIASGSADGTLRIWNATSGAQVHIQVEGMVNTIAWSPDGMQLVTAGPDPRVQVWDIVIGKELKRRTGVPKIEIVTAISKDLGRAIDSELQVWDIGYDKGKILKMLPKKYLVLAAVFIHGDTQVAFCGLFDHTIHVWDMESGECTSKVELESDIYGIAVSHDGNILASSTIDRIHFFCTKSWDSLGSFQGYFDRTASFSPDDRRLLTSYYTIQVWDLSSVLVPIPRITSPIPSSLSSTHDTRIHFVAISLNGSRVAAVTHEAISIWSLKSASLLCTIRGYNYGNIAFSPDAQKIAVAGYETHIWDMTTFVHTLNSPNDRITWSSDGHWIAGGTYDANSDVSESLGVFDAVTGELEKYLEIVGGSSDLEFSHDNTMLYVKCMTGEKTIFRWKEGKKVELEQHRWETEIGRRMRLHKDGWIVREEDGKRLCWVEQGYPLSIARWGNYYAVGKNSGKLDILHIEESSVDGMTEDP